MAKHRRYNRSSKMDCSQNRRTTHNRTLVERVVNRIIDGAYFFGSHHHKPEMMSWSQSVRQLGKLTLRRKAIDASITYLTKSAPWTLMCFVAVDVGDNLEVFSFKETIKDASYRKAGNEATRYIGDRLTEVKDAIDGDLVYKDITLDKSHSIAGFAYYLFNGTDFLAAENEDAMADDLVEQGIFDEPFDLVSSHFPTEQNLERWIVDESLRCCRI